VHISFKYGRNRLPVPACGVIAIGQCAAGVVTVAQFGVGAIALAQFAIAGLAVAQFGIAHCLLAQIGVYISYGYGQVVIPLARLLGY
jgi:hypothetical protein